MTSYGRSPDSTALAPLPAQDRMCPNLIGCPSEHRRCLGRPYGLSLDSTALAPLPAQDRMCPFGIIGVAARYSPTGPLGKVALRPARLHLAAHGYIERNTGRGAVLPPSKLTRDLAPGPFPDGNRPPTAPQGDKDVHNRHTKGVAWGVGSGVCVCGTDKRLI